MRKQLKRLFWLLAGCGLALMAHAEGFMSLFGGAKQQNFLSPDAAYGLQIDVTDGRTLLANFKVAPGYYLYRSKLEFTLDKEQNKGLSIARINLPQGEMKQDANFGLMEVYHQSFQAEIALDRKDEAAREITVEASYQGCSEKGLCYPPINKTFKLTLPPASAQAAASTTAPSIPENENSQIARLFKHGSFWLVMSFFFGAGLLLSFTPCMFPMVPILSGIIVGRGQHITHAHGFFLSLAYVLGMALTYAGVGVLAGFTGTLLSNALQTPWALGSFALIFVLLALSMFGLYELQLPAALQSRLTDTSNKLHGGHLTGVFVMGALSAIIVGPCVAAPLAGALLYIGQTHDAALGGAALFSMSLGMGVPLLLIGASAGALLPKAGAWMESIKRSFGVMLLALAIWIIAPIIPMATQMIMWSALLVLTGIYLGALDALPHTARGWHRVGKGFGILALLLGIAYMVGALSGARDPLRPLGALGNAAPAAESALPFSRIKTQAELDVRIAQAHGKAVMLDFYADWCISCKEMERFTFSDARVKARLQNAVLLQADVTENNPDDKALLKRFNLYGPPAILFFDPQGTERSDARVMGYEDADRFIQSLKDAGL